MDIVAAMAMTARLWLSLPHGDTAWDLLETVAPFAFTEPMNTGGTLTGVPLLVGSDASSWTQTSFRLGVADVTDPVTGGRPLLYPDLSVVGTIRLTTSATGLQSGAPGPVMVLEPKAGGATWDRSLAMAFSPSPFQATGSSATAPVARLRALGRVQASTGGPLTSRVRMFAAGTGTWSSHVERREPYALPGDLLSLAVHPTLEISPNRRADLTAWIQHTKTAFAARALLRDRNATATQWYGGLAGTWHSGIHRIAEVSGALSSGRVAPKAEPDTIRGTVERLVDDPIETLVSTTGGTRSRASIAATLSTGSRIRVNGGINLSGSRMQALPFGAGLIGETINGIPARAWDYGLTGDSHRSETTFAIHGSAETRLFDRLDASAGLRLEQVDASARGAASGIAWTSLQPRLALQYARGPWSGILSARRYHPALPLTILSSGDPAGPFGRTYLWTDGDRDGFVQNDELGALVALVGPGRPTPGFSTIDPTLRRPYLDELEVAIDVRIKPSVSLRFSGTSRRGANLLARYDTGVPFAAYSVHLIPDPGLNLGGPEDDQMLPIYSRPPATFGKDQYLLTNIPSVHSTHGGLELAVLFERSPRWHLLAAATALRSRAPAAFRGHAPSENDELIIGDSYSDPNSNTYVEGRTLFDRGYGLKVASSYNARRRLTVAAVGRYADGQNFARLVLAPDLPQGPDLVRAYANGKSKFTYTATLDMRVQKIVTWAGRDITLGVESFNLTNLRNEVEEVTITGPLWRKPTLTQPPRVIRLTAGVTF
jgi:hypothetical protein